MQKNTPLERYQEDLQRHGFTHDSAQLSAITHLQRLYDALLEAPKKPSTIARVRSVLGLSERKEPVVGLYFWGGVGRGKTYLMDVFFDSLPFEQKLRTHFHRFMRSVHKELTGIKSHQDPLEIIAERFSKRYRVICFDEFFVVDITDAMILANLLDGLFRRGVTLVATSNIEPSGLYQNGLQRIRFLPAIALIEKFTQVINVDGGVDYRLRTLKQGGIYYYPLDAVSEGALSACFNRLVPTEEHLQEGVSIEVEGRSIETRKFSDGVLWCDFYALCDGPRSQNDYIELAREFHTVLVSGIPVFEEKNDDQARRFIYLVDEFYDRNVKLVLAAEAHFSSLYHGGRLSFEFRRTESRLQEMQSEAYLALAHKG